jgi:hypothetical protein
MEQPAQQQFIIDRGMEARAFYKSCQESPYFFDLLNGFKVAALAEMANLKPDQQIEFTILNSQIKVPDALLNTILGDIDAGERALSEREGTTQEPKGLL